MPEETFETPQPVQTVEPKTTNGPKIVLTAVLGFGLLVGAACAGYWYGTRENSNLKSQISKPQLKTQNQPTPTPTPTPTPEPTNPPVTDPTVSWKIYNHPSGLYTLKYPLDLVYKEEDIPNSTCKKGLILADRDTGFSEEYQGDIVIDICPVMEDYPFPEAAFANITGSDAQPIVVDGRQGFAKTGDAIFPKLRSKANIKRVVFLEGGVLFAMDARYIPGHPNLDQVFDQILSTFKFLE